MKRSFTIRGLLAGSAMFISTAALAQDPASTEPATEAQPDQSDETADAAIQQASDLDDAQAKIELLQAQVEALQEAIAQVQAAQTKAVPTWKGAPELADKDAGFTFKPKGFMQWDAGWVGFPEGEQLRGTVAGLNFANLGFNSRARRLVLGAEGALPGGFGYKFELNFAQATVGYEDIILTYDMKGAPLQISVGNFYPYSSLETMTSSRLGTMLERASFTDAFNFNRRLGIGIQLSDKAADNYLVQAGIFSTPIDDISVSGSSLANSFTRTGWQASLRGVYAPTLGDVRLHLGANFQHRTNNLEGQQAQYRARPLTQITGERFIDTGNIASRGDDVFGIELGAIYKSLHFAAEGQKLWVRDAYDVGEIADLVDPENNDLSTGNPYNGDPSFKAGYIEIGYFLTGETRAYKGGKWDRTKVLKPFDKGGWGAFQINGRVDYVDLRDRVADAPDGASDAVAHTFPYYVNGGRQIGYQASLVWNPVDWVKFMAQYGHINITGGPRNSLADDTTGVSVIDRKLSVDTVAFRAQLEF